MTLEEFEIARSRLRDEIVALRDLRDQYLALFAYSVDRVEMLNFCAGWFFATVQRSFLRDILLGICRLTDPEESFGHANLVLQVLLQDPQLEGRIEPLTAVHHAVDEAVRAAAPFRAHRHKYIAHLDHAAAVGDPSYPLPELVRAEIDEAIHKIERAYNAHSGPFRGSDVSFSVGTVRGVDALIKALMTSERWHLHGKLREQRTNNGAV